MTSTTQAAYEAALARLPGTYAHALRCVESGMPQDQLCRVLDIEPEGLQPLLELARRKLHKELTRA